MSDTRYAKLVNNIPPPRAAPRAVRIGGAVVCNPTDAQCEVRELPPPPPRRWSRLAIKTALAQAGMLSEALDYLYIVEIAPGYSAEDALAECDYIEEGYPDATWWNALLNGAAKALDKTREEIDALLDAIPTEN